MHANGGASHREAATERGSTPEDGEMDLESALRMDSIQLGEFLKEDKR